MFQRKERRGTSSPQMVKESASFLSAEHKRLNVRRLSDLFRIVESPPVGQSRFVSVAVAIFGG